MTKQQAERLIEEVKGLREEVRQLKEKTGQITYVPYYPYRQLPYSVPYWEDKSYGTPDAPQITWFYDTETRETRIRG